MASVIVDVHICGGVVIDSFHILTAAHCVVPQFNFKRLKVSRHI